MRPSSRRLLQLALAVAGALLLAALAVVSVMVQREAAPEQQALGGAGPRKALVLYHPSRDARFSDELSLALAAGLKDAGLAVERATLTAALPSQPQGYALLVVVSNTYYWAPDLPTQHYLARARLQGQAAVGVIGGAGATARSQRLLEEALRASGAQVLGVRSWWLMRPNDENRLSEPNRAVALEKARAFGAEAGRAAPAAP